MSFQNLYSAQVHELFQMSSNEEFQAYIFWSRENSMNLDFLFFFIRTS